MNIKKNIVVICGGFPSLQFIQNLDMNEFNVLFLDKLNQHQFQPLFYQVTTVQLEPSSISFPFRENISAQKKRSNKNG